MRFRLGVFGLALLLGTFLFPTGWTDAPTSRLNRLIERKAELYMPFRLLTGTENQFILKGKPGWNARLLISTKEGATEVPNGVTLPVSDDAQHWDAVIPASGVVTFSVPLPADTSLIDAQRFVAAVTWSQEDYSDLELVTLINNDGRRTSENKLSIAEPVKPGKGSWVVPNLPGLNANMLHSLQNLSEIQNDPTNRKKELMAPDGNINPDLMIDKIPYLQQPQH